MPELERSIKCCLAPARIATVYAKLAEYKVAGRASICERGLRFVEGPSAGVVAEDREYCDT
jgi:hypothetical protein